MIPMCSVANKRGYFIVRSSILNTLCVSNIWYLGNEYKECWGEY